MARIKEGEKLTKENIKRVIELLEGSEPITKKRACEILNISYNTGRLNRIIQEFKEKEEKAKLRRAKLRGTPLSEQELAIIAAEYLNGESISAIAELLYRPTLRIKKALKQLNIPERTSEVSYHNPYFVETISSEYNEGDLVFAARYGVPATIVKNLDGEAYRIYLLGNFQQYAVQPYWELGDLRYVQNKLGIKIPAHQGIQPANNPQLRK